MIVFTRMVAKTTDSVVHLGVHQRSAWRRPFLISYHMLLHPGPSSHQILMLVQCTLSSGHSDNTNGNSRGVPMDAFRVSLSSAVSSSSHGSGHDDGDALGDVFIWGEGTG